MIVFNKDKILVVDFGSQYTQLIARRIREEGVFCSIIPFNKADEFLSVNNTKAIILSGGPETVKQKGSPKIADKLFDNANSSESPPYDDNYIACQDLFKIFKPADLEVVALRGLDLSVKEGELVAIVGSSGSGKTTLLNILAGLERPSAGQVHIGKRDMLNISDKELVSYRRQDVGFVWQTTRRNLVPYLSVIENIELPMAISGIRSRQRKEHSRELLTVLGMEDKQNRSPAELSGGEQQRVAIAVALANQPPLLLADEPTGELDSQMADEIFDLFQDMNRTFGTTIVIVTHYPGIAQFVNRVVIIRDGRISAETLLQASFQRSGGSIRRDYLVVDQVGRLQIPKEILDEIGLVRLATAQMVDGQIHIQPASTDS